MLVACLRLCMCVWMDKYLQRRNAGKKRKRWQVGRLFPSAILCLLAHKPLKEGKKIRRTNLHWRSCPFHFNLHCTLTTGWHRPVCDLVATGLFANTAGRSQAVSQFVCKTTLGSRRWGERKRREGKKERKKKHLCFTLALLLLEILKKSHCVARTPYKS